jgi:hypothetical protein
VPAVRDQVVTIYNFGVFSWLISAKLLLICYRSSVSILRRCKYLGLFSAACLVEIERWIGRNVFGKYANLLYVDTLDRSNCQWIVMRRTTQEVTAGI